MSDESRERVRRELGRAQLRAHARVDTWLHRASPLGHGEPEETAAGALEHDEIRRVLRNAVAQLPDTHREVIERCVYQEQRPGW